MTERERREATASAIASAISKRHVQDFLENATVHGRAWYKLLDAPVLASDVTVSGERERER